MEGVTQRGIFIFYLALIVFPSIITYYLAQPEHKMVYAMGAALGGVVLSTVLWFRYGKQAVGL